MPRSRRVRLVRDGFLVLVAVVTVGCATHDEQLATISTAGNAGAVAASSTSTTGTVARTTVAAPPSPDSTNAPPAVPPAPTTTVLRAVGGIVHGTVLFSPVCPVERIPPDPACAPRPGPAAVRLLRADGAVAAEADAGTDGVFSLSVPAGHYTVTAVPAASGGVGRGCGADPSIVTVTDGSSTTVSVSCDTGIR